MAKTQEIDFLMNYPAVILQDGKYSGYIFINDVSYPVSIIPNEDKTSYKLENNPKITKFHHLLPSDCSEHPVEILNSLKTLISDNSANAKATLHPTETWKKVLLEIAEFNNYHITVKSCKLSHDFSGIQIVHVDREQRCHEVSVKVNYAKESKLFEIEGYDLPEGCNFQVDDNLVLVFDKFAGAVEGFQDIFDLMDRIDEDYWVLDPEKPMRKDCYRRIALNEKLSIVVTFSPINVHQRPDIKFLGPLNLVDPLMEKYNSNFINWDLNGDVIDELLNLLELDSFPPKPQKESEQDLVLVNVGECCVCYSLRLEDKLPEIICPNRSCSQFFHSECLYQWLSLLNPKRFSNTVYGQCPNCEKPIECPIPKTK